MRIISRKTWPYSEWYLTIFSIFVCACMLILLWFMGLPISNAEKEQEKLSAEMNHENNPFIFKHKKDVLLKSLQENGRRMEKRIEFKGTIPKSV